MTHSIAPGKKKKKTGTNSSLGCCTKLSTPLLQEAIPEYLPPCVSHSIHCRYQPPHSSLTPTPTSLVFLYFFHENLKLIQGCTILAFNKSHLSDISLEE